ncbi:hypothetical protein ACFZB9_35435 [Kitasatospora sp. NPDC008050]|uniref:AfsR/SARP family transcriptional regulator n=1 Tax=Kitasatospora sp. NPDC008050 TaxID=3364021 RepID=UPI0036EF20BD
MQILLLGPIELRTDEGRPVAIGGDRQRALLAALALEINQVVPLGRLAQLVWDGTPPPDAPAVLRTEAAELGSRLGGGLELLAREDGYLLRGDAQRVDVHRFQSLLDDAARLAEPEPEPEPEPGSGSDPGLDLPPVGPPPVGPGRPDPVPVQHDQGEGLSRPSCHSF